MVPQTKPSSWDEHDRPWTSQSRSSSVLGDEQALIDDDDYDGDEVGGRAIRGAERRRSSVTNRIAAMADFGGPNSFRSFARSWQRAAAFPEVIPRRPSLVFSHEQPPQQDVEASLEYGRSVVAPAGPHSGLLRQHLEASLTQSAPSADDDARRESKDLERACEHLPPLGLSSTRSSIFAVPPRLATPSIIGSYQSQQQQQQQHYGTMSPRSSLRPRIVVRGGSYSRHDDDMDAAEVVDLDTALGEEQPILVKEVRQGNKMVLTVEGQSTLPQSVFNSINAIIGVGMLSLPLAFRLSGWLLGLAMLSLTALVTAHTARLLARCMDYDKSLITYSDLAFISFGTRARVVVSALFTLELAACCVALIILFADSLALLLPDSASVTTWKCFCALSILILNTLPLRWLSYTSIVGIFSTFCIVCIVTIDGFIKPDTPGSLRHPATTHLFPSNWFSLPIAYGLMLSPWGAHSVFPSIYRDMRHPYKWDRGVKITFSFSYVLDTCLAIVGILMFGDGISEAITNNIIRTSAYPKGLTILMSICVSVIPLTKLPLNIRPLITTADVLCGMLHDPQLQAPPSEMTNSTPSSKTLVALSRPLARAIIRLTIVGFLLVISILFPAFDSVCAFLGAALCSLISVVLPILFHLKLYWRDVALTERLVSILLLLCFSLLGLIGTVWTLLPKTLLAA